MIEETIDILTNQMIRDKFKSNKNDDNQTIVMTKFDLYKFSIKLLKLIKQYENMEGRYECSKNNSKI